MPNQKITLQTYISALIIGLLVLFAATIAGFLTRADSMPAPDENNFITTSEGVVKRVDFPNVTLLAGAAIVLDETTGEILFEKNADVQLPLASLTKIMTVLVASELAPDNVVVSISGDALKTEGENGFTEGERWRFEDLLEAMLVKSSNDSAAAIASVAGAFAPVGTSSADTLEERFIERMNERAKELRLSATYFLNPTGLDTNEAVSGGYGSARDTALLFGKAVRRAPMAFEATREESVTLHSLDDAKYTFDNTNTEVKGLPGIIASKTGFTDLAGGNLAVMFEAGPVHPITIIVLGSTKEGRFEDAKKLSEATLRFLAEER